MLGGCVRDVGSDSDFRRGGPPFGLGRLTGIRTRRVWKLALFHFRFRDGRGLIKRRMRPLHSPYYSCDN